MQISNFGLLWLFGTLGAILSMIFFRMRRKK